ncbi:HIRAN domain-containing protein [Bacillus sp. REN16]|uniref:HIRAN domain-containing protein n=1 Tax=Bacillus sp. REN16 TaxID=2887296 RepID=UPI001E486071|nr:HIRAN domain-containing protein [Bacillus sp. REN16]MCC3356123.1 hypothetical protein [Bacillus sp. REN16]
MHSIKSLLVVWKSKEKNLYFHIGTLSYDGEKYIFEYTHHSNSHRKVLDAVRNGYRIHPAFPDVHKKYIAASLFPAFDRRIPSSDRVDYKKVLKDLNLPFGADRMDILRETRGILSGDAYSFEEPLRVYENNQFETNFYINGMRHQDLPENWVSRLSVGSSLQAIPDYDNEFDPYAVKMETVEGIQLGYVPGVSAQAVKALVERGVQLSFYVKEIKSTLAPQWWVRVNLIGNLETASDGIFNEKDFEGLIFKVA